MSLGRTAPIRRLMVQFALGSVHPTRSASVVIQIQGSVILTAIPGQASHYHATATGFCESQEGYWSAVFLRSQLDLKSG